jgi:hypothetical protein
MLLCIVFYTVDYGARHQYVITHNAVAGSLGKHPAFISYGTRKFGLLVLVGNLSYRALRGI